MQPDHPVPHRAELAQVLEEFHRDAERFLSGLDERPVRTAAADDAMTAFGGPLPEHGNGADCRDCGARGGCW